MENYGSPIQAGPLTAKPVLSEPQPTKYGLRLFLHFMCS